MKHTKKMMGIVIKWYLIGLLLEIVLEVVLSIDLQGILTHVLPIYRFYKYIKKHDLKLGFLKAKKSFKEQIKFFPAVYGMELILTLIIMSAILFFVKVTGFDFYSEIYNKLLEVFSEIAAPKGILVNMIAFVSVCIAGPIVEEILFRGLLYDYLKEKTPKYTILITTLLFGLIHGGIQPQHYIGGYMLAKYREKDGDIYGAIIAHMFNNFMVYVQDASVLATDFIQVFLMCYFIYYTIKNGYIFKKEGTVQV
ncbi:MAG: CPBP family intramembrane metalloprotease [Erysipelothrix sp.]|nr:CPBP family intramembrane metalloprotease [Erysipelothrix sp.]